MFDSVKHATLVFQNQPIWCYMLRVPLASFRHQTKLKITSRDKQPSLFVLRIYCKEEKVLLDWSPGSGQRMGSVGKTLPSLKTRWDYIQQFFIDIKSGRSSTAVWLWTPNLEIKPNCSAKEKCQWKKPEAVIFCSVRSFYDQAMSNLDRSMHRSLWIWVTHSSFIEGSHMTKNTASGVKQS
jgi:hypothetical protein